MLWRALERAGIGLLVACALAVILYPILLWRGERAMPMILGALGLGAFCGLLFGLKSRPTRLDAAIEADRQLKLHDLLSSAISVTDAKANEWSAAVIAMAEAKCRSIAPREVILNRLGVRAWGGIGLSAALLLTLGLLSTNPIVTQAVATVSGRTPTVANTTEPPPTEAIARAQGQSPANRQSEASDETRSQIPEPVDSKVTTDERASTVRNNSADGAGAGQSKTDQRSSAPLAQTAAPSTSHDETGTRIAAGGSASEHSRGTGENTGANVSASSPTNVPAWQSSDWSNARQQALRDVRENKTPPAYNDLIRDYFNRDGVDH